MNYMKIEYIRNMQSGYMRIVLQNPLSRTEEAMLSQNTIEGILPVRWQQENDMYMLRYDITGKQALDGLLENSMADEKMLRSLLIGISVVIRQLEKYLLPQEGLLLQPEAIFWDYKTETMHFCYYPEEELSLQERLKRLMEYMLAKTDHRNIWAVQLVYGVYEEVQTPSFCMGDLYVYLQKWSNQEPKVLCEEKQEPETEAEVQRPWSGEREHIKNKIMAWIKEKIKKRSKREAIPQNVILGTEEWGMQETATTVLGAAPEKIEGYLKYEGVNALPDIPVTKIPFVIGASDDCDGVIKHRNISRYHAKITYRDDTYFIEDLNSTNGTRVNGGLLSYKTRVSLKKNESIYFANEVYRFL